MGTEASGVFEERFAKLEEAVRRLEGGEETLEASLAIYEEAVGNLRACLEILARAEGRVKALSIDGDGGVAEADFEEEA